MNVAELVVQIGADVSDLRRGMLEAQAMIQGFADKTNGGGGAAGGGWLKQTTNFLKGLPGLASKANSWLTTMFYSFGNWMSSVGGGLPILSTFGSIIQLLAPALSIATMAVTGIAAAFGLVFVGLTLVLFVWNLFMLALSAAIGLIVTFLGPLGVLILAFGSLMIAATQVWGVLNNKHIPMFHHLQGILKSLGSQFDVLIRRLADDFLPIITKIAEALKPFVYYLEKVANMSLGHALHSLATTGVKEFNHLLGVVTHALARPFRMLIDFAFGQGGTAMNKEIGGLASRAQRFFLQGQTWVDRGKGPHGAQGGGVRVLNGKSIWDTFKTWFDRQHVMKLGERIANDIMSGIETAAGAAKFGQWLDMAFIQAVKEALLLTIGLFVGAFLEIFVLIYQAAVAFWHLMADLMKALNGPLWKWLWKIAVEAWHAIEKYAEEAWKAIEGVAKSVWASVVAAVKSAWDSTWNAITSKASAFWNWLTGRVGTWAHDAYTWITSGIASAFDWVKGKIEGFWSWLTGLLSKVLTLHISVPGLSTIEHVLGSVGGAASSAWNGVKSQFGGATGAIVTRPTISLIGEAGPEALIPLSSAPGARALGGLGGGNVVIQITGPVIGAGNTHQLARELARLISPHLSNTPQLA